MSTQRQEQSSNTPEFWAKTAWRVISKDMEANLRERLEGVVKTNVQNWVLDIREDEISAIIRELEKRHLKLGRQLDGAEVLELLRDRMAHRKM